MNEDRNFIVIIMVALTILPLSALVSSSYVTFNPVMYHVAEPKVEEYHLDPVSPSFSYYVYNFSLVGDKLEIKNSVTHSNALFDLSSSNATIFTVSNTSVVYIWSRDSILEVVLSPYNVSSHKEFKLSEEDSPWYVHGCVLASNQVYTTWVGVMTIEAENGSDEYLLFTPTGGVMKFRANVTSYYESGRLWLFDLANGSTLLVGVGNETFRGALEFPYYFKGEVIFYNSTSGFLEEYSPTQGGQSLSTTQQSPLKAVNVSGVQNVLYLGDLVVISVSGHRQLTLVYSLPNWSRLVNVSDQVTAVVYNVSSIYVFSGSGNTTLLNSHFNSTRAIPGSEVYCVDKTVVVEYPQGGEVEVYIPAKSQSYSLQGIDLYEQPVSLGSELLAFPENRSEGGLTWIWAVNLSSRGSFQALAYYSNTTYEFGGIYYFYNGTVYNMTGGTLVDITAVNSSGYIRIYGGTVNVTVMAGNVSLILPDGQYNLTYLNRTETLSLNGTVTHVYLPALLKASSTSTTTQTTSSTTSTTFTLPPETSLPPIGVSPPPGQSGAALNVNLVDITLIVLGYISIIGIYLYRRRK